MLKLIYQNDLPDALLLKAGGQLSTFFDRDDGLIKSASSSAISQKMMLEHKPDKDHYGMHIIAMGSSPMYGFNRNGDWWETQDLIDRHNTFVKYGHYFLEHNHHSPDLAIGKIVASAYHPELHRVELIIHGHKKKDEEGYEMAKSGKAISGSMSAKVAGDICSCCDHFARTSEDYCIHAKNHMTQWLKKFGKFVYVKNVRPRFFDYSRVKNRADRIAVYIQYVMDDDMKKAASENSPFELSAKLAESAKLRDIIDPLPVELEPWLKKMATLEEYREAVVARPDNVAKDALFYFCKNAAAFADSGALLDNPGLEAARKIDPEAFFHLMAKKATVLPFVDFAAYATNQPIDIVTKDPAVKYAQEHCLDTVFRDLQSQDNWEAAEQFKSASTTRMQVLPLYDNIERVVTKLASRASVSPAFRGRILGRCADAIGGTIIKSAATEFSKEQVEKGKLLARLYGMYKLAFCEAASSLSDTDFRDDATLLLVLAQK